MRISPCYEIDLEEADLTPAGQRKFRELYEYVVGHPIYTIEWSDPIATLKIDELPVVEMDT